MDRRPAIAAILGPANTAKLDAAYKEYVRLAELYLQLVKEKKYVLAEAMRVDIVGLAEQTRGWIGEVGITVKRGTDSETLKKEFEEWSGIAFDFTTEFTKFQMMETIERNIDTTVVRMVQRGFLASQRKDKDLTSYDTYPPFDVGLSAEITVEDPRVIRVRGSWNVLSIGSRLRLVLRDPNDPLGRPAGMDWDYRDTVELEPAASTTYMQDSLFIKNRKFNRRIDMSKDRTMYPFALTSPEYVIELFYSPRSTAPHLQDKFGYNGEGLTDQRYLNTDVRQGQRVIYCRLPITRDQLLRKGEWLDKVPVIKTPNFRSLDVLKSTDDVILVPSMRAGQQQ